VHKLYLSTGSNLGDKNSNLLKAKQSISIYIGSIIKTSSIYVSEPWGFQSEEQFYNQLLIVETDLLPQEVLREIHKIEKALGRKKTTKQWDSRVIDIDILFYDNVIYSSNSLKIPHPLLQERKFVLLPLSEIDNEYIHPIINMSIAELLTHCPDHSLVQIINQNNL